MNTLKLTTYPIFVLLSAIILLLAACQPAAPATIQLPTKLAATPVLVVTLTPTTEPGGFNLDLSAISPSQSVETVAAVPLSADTLPMEVMPQYTRVTLENYPVSGHSMKPQIFIYPAADLVAANESAGKMVTDLKALLQARQPVDRMPFLPVNTDVQVMHPQVQYLDFKNGKGVRFLTQFNQAPVVINNNQLIYSFQGLTNDGKTYVAVILPVTHPGLPDNQQVFAENEADMRGFPSYMAKAIAWLDQLPASSFAPDLAKLDALIQSIEVK